MLSFIYDMTDRLNAERELQESRQRLSDIINFLPDATFVIDRDRRVIAWNTAMEEMTGIGKDEMIGRGDYAYTVPFYGEPRPQLLDLLYTSDPTLESRYCNFVRKGRTLYAEAHAPALYGGGGAYIWMTGTPLYDAQGHRVGAIESIRDIRAQTNGGKTVGERKTPPPFGRDDSGRVLDGHSRPRRNNIRQPGLRKDMGPQS
jgi:PAS domain S-box-containing protein